MHLSLLFLVLPFAVATNQIRQNVVYMSFALCMIIQFVCFVIPFAFRFLSSTRFSNGSVLILYAFYKCDNVHGIVSPKPNTSSCTVLEKYRAHARTSLAIREFITI